MLISHGVSMIGKKESKKISDDHFLALQRISVPVERGCISEYYKRITINDELIVSKQYTRVVRRNSYTVLLTDDEIFGISIFVVLKVLNESVCYAMGKYFKRCSNTKFPGRQLQQITMVKPTTNGNLLAAVEARMIKEKVNIVGIPDTQLFFACKHPNRFELLT